MNTVREIEYKGIITESEYWELTEQYKERLSLARQSNYYFDTDNFELYRNGYSFRIRKKDKRFILTLNDNNKSSISFSYDRTEYNKEISAVQFQNFLSSGIDIEQLQKINPGITLNKDIKYIGALRTLRGGMDLGEGLLLEIDKNEYSGITDYEIECEYNNDVMKKSLEFLWYLQYICDKMQL